jgi:hypothetical protein
MPFIEKLRLLCIEILYVTERFPLLRLKAKTDSNPFSYVLHTTQKHELELLIFFQTSYTRLSLMG